MFQRLGKAHFVVFDQVGDHHSRRLNRERVTREMPAPQCTNTFLPRSPRFNFMYTQVDLEPDLLEIPADVLTLPVLQRIDQVLHSCLEAQLESLGDSDH